MHLETVDAKEAMGLLKVKLLLEVVLEGGNGDLGGCWRVANHVIKRLEEKYLIMPYKL